MRESATVIGAFDHESGLAGGIVHPGQAHLRPGLQGPRQGCRGRRHSGHDHVGRVRVARRNNPTDRVHSIVVRVPGQHRIVNEVHVARTGAGGGRGDRGESTAVIAALDHKTGLAGSIVHPGQAHLRAGHQGCHQVGRRPQRDRLVGKRCELDADEDIDAVERRVSGIAQVGDANGLVAVHLDVLDVVVGSVAAVDRGVDAIRAVVAQDVAEGAILEDDAGIAGALPVLYGARDVAVAGGHMPVVADPVEIVVDDDAVAEDVVDVTGSGQARRRIEAVVVTETRQRVAAAAADQVVVWPVVGRRVGIGPGQLVILSGPDQALYQRVGVQQVARCPVCVGSLHIGEDSDRDIFVAADVHVAFGAVAVQFDHREADGDGRVAEQPVAVVGNRAKAAFHQVVARAAVEVVVADAAAHPVVAVAGEHLIDAVTALHVVVAVAAEHKVGVSLPEQHVVAVAAEHLVDAVAAVDLVIAVAAVRGVERARTGRDVVVAGAAVDEVVVLVVRDPVVAGAAIEVVVALGAFDDVVPGIAINVVVAERRDDVVVALETDNDDVSVIGAAAIREGLVNGVEVVVDAIGVSGPDTVVRIVVVESVERVVGGLEPEGVADVLQTRGAHDQVGELLADDLVAEVMADRHAIEIVEAVGVLHALAEVGHDEAEGGAERGVEQRLFGKAADPQVDIPEAQVAAAVVVLVPGAGDRIVDG